MGHREVDRARADALRPRLRAAGKRVKERLRAFARWLLRAAAGLDREQALHEGRAQSASFRETHEAEQQFVPLQLNTPR